MNFKSWVYLLFRPWLLLPSSVLYFFSFFGIKIYSRLNPDSNCQWKSFSWKGLYFSNPLGTAGGVDKNALLLKEWSRLGAGFLEVGTITPKPQSSNSGKILDRSLKHKSLWNNMGFPNKGIDFVKKKLSSLKESQSLPIFINIGKNRHTPLSQAIEDYRYSLKTLHTFASAFVINISSPNTKGLRDFFDKETLPLFLTELKKTMVDIKSEVPLILKLSPDEDFFLRIIEQSLQAGIDGWCICNSTKERKIPNLFPIEGGVSGHLIFEKSLNLLKELKQYLEEKQIKDKLIISCGGVFTAQDVLERLEAGANLVQVYSVLVFEGPGFFQSVAKKIN